MSRPFIPAIETRAFGCRFRSRLEARWAVFLTVAGFDWDYEPQGVRTEHGNYLCDFKVTKDGVSVWLEVKPPVNDFDDPRWADLASLTGMMLFTVRGMHRRGDDCGTAHSARVWAADGTVAQVHGLWQSEQYDQAWDAASSARFDGTDVFPGARKRGK